MTTSTTHLAIAALNERLAQQEHALQYWQRAAKPSTQEEEMLLEIARLEEQIATIRRHRAQAAGEVRQRLADIAKMKKTIELAMQNDEVAQALWMKLLTERKTRNL